MDQLIINKNNELVANAIKSETSLFDHYGIEAEEQYVQLTYRGYRVRVLIFGQGEPLLIVPGNTGDGFALASLIDRINGRRVYLMNRPGGGMSDGMDHREVDMNIFPVQVITEVMNYFKMSTIDLLGHSMGAHWCLLMALENPKRIRSLTLLGNPGKVMKGNPPFLMRLAMKQPFASVLMPLLLPRNRLTALSVLKKMGHSDKCLDNQPEGLRDCYHDFRKLPNSNLSLLSLMSNLPDTILSNTLNKLIVPTLLVFGDQDTFATVEEAQNMVDAMPKGLFALLKGAGHLPWLENPATCWDIIEQFINSNK